MHKSSSIHKDSLPWHHQKSVFWQKDPTGAYTTGSSLCCFTSRHQVPVIQTSFLGSVQALTIETQTKKSRCAQVGPAFSMHSGECHRPQNPNLWYNLGTPPCQFCWEPDKHQALQVRCEGVIVSYAKKKHPSESSGLSQPQMSSLGHWMFHHVSPTKRSPGHLFQEQLSQDVSSIACEYHENIIKYLRDVNFLPHSVLLSVLLFFS